MRGERRESGGNRVLIARNLLAQLRDYGAGVQLLHLATERVAKGLGRLHQLFELNALLRAERRLSKQVVVRKCVARLNPRDGVERLSFAGCFNLAGAQE